MPSDPSYASYLLRLRKVRNDRQLSWVATVQSTATGEQRSFPSVEALATFLLANFRCGLAVDDLGARDPACQAESSSTQDGE